MLHQKYPSMRDTGENPLHGQLLPILHAVLATQPPTSGMVLDLACGTGEKLPLIEAACGHGADTIALDIDRKAVRQAAGHAMALVGDALALPLRAASCDRAYCIAALSLFANQAQALSELRRVLKPGGQALIVTATQLWAQVIHWPGDVQHVLAKAYAATTPLAAHADLADGAERALHAADFRHCFTRAFLLDDSPPLVAELALLDWQRVRPQVTNYLAPDIRDRCDQIASEAEIELCSIMLVIWA